MSHEVYAESVAAYSLGALDTDERRAFEEHLPTCAQCQADLRAYRRVAVALDSAVPPETPPASLRARTLAHATAQPQEPASSAPPIRGSGVARMTPRSTTGVLDKPRTGPRPPRWLGLATAASVTIAVMAILYALALQSQVSSLREMVADANDQSDRLREELIAVREDASRLIHTVRVVTSPDAQRVRLSGQEGFTGASALAYWSRANGIVLNAEQLPSLQPDRVYQLWVVQSGQAVSGGTFRTDASGRASYTTSLPPTISTVEALAVSLEPDPGVPARTGPVVLLGKTEN